MRKISMPIILTALAFYSCASTSSVADAYADGSLVAEQRSEIEQLKRDLQDMAANQCEVSDRIDRITQRLASGLERCTTIEDIFTEVDRFVRDLIDENNKLRNLQRTDRPTDARE